MKNPSSASFKVGAIALAFLVIGYQAALFTTRAARLRLEANRDHPDTVYIWGSAPEPPAPLESLSNFADGKVTGPGRSADADFASLNANQESSAINHLAHGMQIVRRNAQHSPYVEAYRRETRRVESFRFNPNTVSLEDLQRLGFSEKQAAVIDRYRASGGRFRRKADFAKSFVVADSVYRRLERYIDIPRLDLNRADSTALDDLPGIGPWYASRILEHRAALGGFSYPEQLMDIYRFDRQKYDAVSDLIYCSPPEPYPLWSLPADSLRLHPYIRTERAARAIVLFRDNTPPEGLTLDALAATGILPPEDAERLRRCVIAEP